MKKLFLLSFILLTFIAGAQSPWAARTPSYVTGTSNVNLNNGYLIDANGVTCLWWGSHFPFDSIPPLGDSTKKLANTAWVKRWVRSVITGGGGSGYPIMDSAWTLFGNHNRTPPTNFIGTTDANAVEIQAHAVPMAYFNGDSAIVIIGYANKKVGNISDYIFGRGNNVNGYKNQYIIGRNNKSQGLNRMYIGDTSATDISNIYIDNPFVVYNGSIFVTGSSGQYLQRTGSTGMTWTTIPTYVGDSGLAGGYGFSVTATLPRVGKADTTKGTGRAKLATQNYAFTHEWNTIGNSGTSPGTNFIGTTDTATLIFKVNNLNIGHLDRNGNYGFGYGIFSSATASAQDNIALGDSALLGVVNGIYNIGIGDHSLQSNTSGRRNVAVGTYSLYNNSTGTFNTAIGDSSGFSELNGSNNIFLGSKAGNGFPNNLSNKLFLGNSSNMAKGYLYSHGNGYISEDTNNRGVGTVTSVGLSLPNAFAISNSPVTTSGTLTGAWANNTYLFEGYNAGASSTAADNTGVGYYSLGALTSGLHNTSLGANALYTQTVNSSNTAVGFDALYTNGGSGANANTGVGDSCLYSNTTGTGTGIGYASLFSNTTGKNNGAHSRYSLYSNTTGSDNDAYGAYSLYNNTTASGNSAFGHYALYNANHTASGLFTHNTAHGDSALINATTAYNCTGIGYNTTLSGATDNNETVIGNAAVGKGTNTIVLGNSSVTGLYLGTGSMTSSTYAPNIHYNTNTGQFTATNDTNSSGGTGSQYQLADYTATNVLGSIVNGASGTLLQSNGTGAYPTWVTALANGTTATTQTNTDATTDVASDAFVQNQWHGTDSVGAGVNDTNKGNAALLKINAYNARQETDSVYYTTSSGKNIGAAILVTVSFVNFSTQNPSRVDLDYYKVSTKPSKWTFPSSVPGYLVTVMPTPYVTVSGQTVTFNATNGTTLYHVVIKFTGSRYKIFIFY